MNTSDLTQAYIIYFIIFNTKRMIFIGTSFSVNITQMALQIASDNQIPIEIVDPNPIKVDYNQVTYHAMKASEYIKV